MHTKRVEHDHYTEIIVWNEGDQPAYQSYRITCANFDFDYAAGGSRILPTVRITLLSSPRATVEEVRRLAAEYTYVADLAEKLQAEKRAVYEWKDYIERNPAATARGDAE
jgi:hypothetical protein